MCNQSLMKLVTPEDDEPDEARPGVPKQAEPDPDDTPAEPGGPASGEAVQLHSVLHPRAT